MVIDPSTGRLVCDLRGIEAQPDDPAFLDCCLVHVATDDCWRVRPEDAVRIAAGADTASRNVREAARASYLADDWLYPRQRQSTLPTREQAEALLSVRDASDNAPRTRTPGDGFQDTRPAKARSTDAGRGPRERVA